METFLTELESTLNYSENTVKSYRNDLSKLDDFLVSHKLSLNDMVYEDAREFSLLLYESNANKNSINRSLSTYRHFFQYLCEIGELKTNPFKRIHNASVLKKIPTVLTEQEIESVIGYEYTDYTSLMEVTMFNIFYSTGCRLSEVINMKLSELDLKAKRVLVTGKGRKQRYVFISNRCEKILSEYLKERNALLLNLNMGDEEILLVNKKGKQLPLSTVHVIFDKYALILGLNKKFTPHVFRHTFATTLMDNDMDIRLIKELLGHESIGTTQIYTQVSRKHLEDVYNKSHPHSGYSGGDLGGKDEF